MSDDDDTISTGHEPTSIRDPVIGVEVSGYRVTGRLGSGGMGIVYEGEQATIGKRVAIKVLRPEVADNPDVVARLVSEARAVNKVGHRGIVDVFGFGALPDGRQCIVMEYLDGEPLEAVLATYKKQKTLLPLTDVLVILDEVLSALSSAHTAGVIHRDLKPSNIFLCKQRDGSRYVKLLDFGIAKLGVLGHTPATRASIMLGTPAYMAPEQANGGVVGPAMDLYAIGVLAFELLTGQAPFNADSVMEMLMKHANQPAPRVSSLNSAIPASLDELVAQMLEKRPERRPESAEAVRQQVVALKAQALTTAVSALERPGRAQATAERPLAIEVRPVQPTAAFELAATHMPPSMLHSTAVVTKQRDSGEHRVPAAAAAPPAAAAAPAPPASSRHRETAPVPRAGEDPPAIQRSKAPMLVVGALAVVALVMTGLVVSGGSKPAPEEAVTGTPVAVVPPPTAPVVDAKPVVPAPAAADPTPPSAVNPSEVTAQPESPSAVQPPAVEPPAVQPVPVAQKAKPVVASPEKPAPAKPQSAIAEPVEPNSVSAKSPTARLEAMAVKLDRKLTAAEQADENVAMFRKTLKAVRSQLGRAEALTKDDLSRLEVTLLRLDEELSSQ